MPYMGITLATIFTMLRLANEAKMRQVICAGMCLVWPAGLAQPGGWRGSRGTEQEQRGVEQEAGPPRVPKHVLRLLPCVASVASGGTGGSEGASRPRALV